MTKTESPILAHARESVPRPSKPERYSEAVEKWLDKARWDAPRPSNRSEAEQCAIQYATVAGLWALSKSPHAGSWRDVGEFTWRAQAPLRSGTSDRLTREAFKSEADWIKFSEWQAWLSDYRKAYEER